MDELLSYCSLKLGTTYDTTHDNTNVGVDCVIRGGDMMNVLNDISESLGKVTYIDSNGVLKCVSLYHIYTNETPKYPTLTKDLSLKKSNIVKSITYRNPENTAKTEFVIGINPVGVMKNYDLYTNDISALKTEMTWLHSSYTFECEIDISEDIELFDLVTIHGTFLSATFVITSIRYNFKTLSSIVTGIGVKL
jgi:hypothetical protein